MTTLGLPGIHVPTRGEADSDDQHTPQWLLDMVGEFWPGGIDTDPCWSPASLVRAKVVYDGASTQSDGLTAPWFNNVWANVPYSNPAPWADRMLGHCHPSSQAREGLFLVNVSTSVAWFRRARPGQERGCQAVAFFDRRISFIKDGVERRGNDREQMMLWWGERRRLKAFRKVFGRVAWIAT